MIVTRQSPSLNMSGHSEALSLDRSGDMEIMKVKSYVKELLKSRLFLGRYIERRLCDENIGYRDIVVISAAEVELKRDLFETQYKLRSVYPNIKWIGITVTDVIGYTSDSVCLWTEIENQPLGPFWFQIKSIKFREDEIMVLLKCIRHITDSFLELEPILTGASKKVRDGVDNKQETNNSLVSLNETYTEIARNLKNALSISNMKEFVTFLFAFVIAIFTGSTAFVNFLGNFILALIREMSILVKNSTPMFLGLLDFFSKIIGGFYILLAMFFKPSPTVPINKRPISYEQARRQPSQYDNRHFD